MSSPNHTRTEREHSTSCQKEQVPDIPLFHLGTTKLHSVILTTEVCKVSCEEDGGGVFIFSPFPWDILKISKPKRINVSNINRNNSIYLNQMLLFYLEHKR
jgi:hypothetical protein